MEVWLLPAVTDPSYNPRELDPWINTGEVLESTLGHPISRRRRLCLIGWVSVASNSACKKANGLWKTVKNLYYHILRSIKVRAGKRMK